MSGPVSLLARTKKTCKLVSCSSSRGNGPLTPVCEKYMHFKWLSLPMAAGIGPVKWDGVASFEA